MDEKRAKSALKRKYSKAKRIVTNSKKLDKFLIKLEKKLSEVPKIGDKLSKVVVMASMLKKYAMKEYQEVPLNTMIAIVAALLYFVSPLDFIPDWIPFIGYSDDATVIAFCWMAIEKDIDKYIEWRDKNIKNEE